MKCAINVRMDFDLVAAMFYVSFSGFLLCPEIMLNTEMH